MIFIPKILKFKALCQSPQPFCIPISIIMVVSENSHLKRVKCGYEKREMSKVF